MRRYIVIKGNKLTVCIESIGQDVIPSFIPLFTLIKSNTTLQLNMRPIAVGRYDIPTGLSITEQAVYLLNCLSRNKTTQATDMELLVKDFINNNCSDGAAIFTNDGFLPESLKTEQEEKNTSRHSV